MPTKRSDPQTMRPSVPGYAFAAGTEGLLPWSWAVGRLEESRQYWIATTRPDGTPHLMIIWGLWLDGSFWFSTGSSSRKARNLAANPKCAIGTDDAANAVILEGVIEAIYADSTEFETFALAYEKKYDWDPRKMGQPVYRVRSNSGFGLVEENFEQTATRWRFVAGGHAEAGSPAGEVAKVIPSGGRP